jgi:hypothetical protein
LCSQKVEDTYKKVNNGEWGWRALRLMSRKSPHFFISGNNPIAKVFLLTKLERVVLCSVLNTVANLDPGRP